jgi:hypothetical protein
MATSIQPLERLEGSISIPSEMRSAEWARVQQWTRERAFYMAGVSKVEILQEMRELTRQSAAGEEGEFALRKRWEAYLDGIDYKPEPGQEGTIKDLRSLRRFNVALRTNRALMNGWALRENGNRPGPMQAQPAWELVRFQEAKVPRDWIDRFERAGGTLYEGRLIAPKTSPVWEQLGSADLFDDALGVDHPPFAWGSGMNWKAVGSREAMRLGVMTAAEIRAQRESADRPVAVSSPSESLQATPAITDEDLRTQLADEMQGLAEWSEEEPTVLVFTDPNGSRPTTPEQLETLWAQTMPETLHRDGDEGLFQRQSVLEFAADPQKFALKPARDQWDDLARAVARVAGPDRKRAILREMADPDRVDWIDALLQSDLFTLADQTTSKATKAVLILRAILNLI